MIGSAVFPAVPAGRLPWLSTEEMIEVDRVMIDDLGIDLPRMMENAGRSLADVAMSVFAPDRVLVLAGSGGNGGGGLVAARHLNNRGVMVSVSLSRSPDSMKPAPRQQLEICKKLGIQVVAEPSEADLIVDALIGYSLAGSPRGRAAELIGWANATSTEVLSLDVPSGLDATTGAAGNSTISASATVTLAAPKRGLRNSQAVGALFLADISVPPCVYDDLGAGLRPEFGAGSILRVV